MENILLDSTRAVLQVAKLTSKEREPYRARLVMDVDDVGLQVVVVAHAQGATRMLALSALAMHVGFIHTEINELLSRPEQCCSTCYELGADAVVTSKLLPGSHCSACGRAA